MSTIDEDARTIPGRNWLRQAYLRVLGDDIGAAIFFGSLILSGLCWQVGLSSPAVETNANTLAAVADGHLYHETPVYGPDAGYPAGTRFLDGTPYGHQYPLVFLSLPLLVLLRASGTIVGPQVLVLLTWAVALVAFARTVGASLERQDLGLKAGIPVASVLLAVNLLLAQPYERHLVPVVALGGTTAIAAALVATTVYRLTSLAAGENAGIAAGVTVVLASPVGIWSTVPRRYSISALVAVLVLYSFYRSRVADEGLRFRSLAYAGVGAAAWVHPLEGVVLLVALVPIDVASARSNGIHEVATVLSVLVLSLVPFFVTNVVLTGNPLLPPQGLATTAGGSGTIDPATGAGGLVTAIPGQVFSLGQSLLGVLTDGERLFEAFVRSEFTVTPVNYVSFGPVNIKVGGEPVSLSLLESMPLLAALVVAAFELSGLVRRARPQLRTESARPTDLLAGTYLVLLCAVYLPRLPETGAVTVGSIHPVYPIGAYLVTRLSVVRSLRGSEWVELSRAFGFLVLVGLPGLVLVVGFAGASGPDHLAQANATVSLVAAALLLYSLVVSTVFDDYRSVAGYALALAGAAGSGFVLLGPFSYVNFADRYALPVGRLLSEVIVI